MQHSLTYSRCMLHSHSVCHLSGLFVGGLEDEYIPLRDVILTVLAPAILGREVLQNRRDLLWLPAKFGGLALSDPVHSTSVAYETSKK